MGEAFTIVDSVGCTIITGVYYPFNKEGIY